MKKNKILLYILTVPFVLTFGIFIYWYLNPSIDNEDFHLQYFLSNPNENYYDVRNVNINSKEFTYNDDIYTNDKEKYKITIHSIDFTKFGEKILVITDFFDDKTRSVNLTYKDKNGIYSPIEIFRKNDSIFIYQLIENSNFSKNLLFKAKSN